MTGQAQSNIDKVFTYCWTHGIISHNPNTQPDRMHNSGTCFNRAHGHQVPVTLPTMLDSNTTVYIPLSLILQ